MSGNKTRPHCSIIGCDLAKKNKITLYKTQNGEPNYVDHQFLWFLLAAAYTKPWGETSKYYRAGLLVGACTVWH